MLRRSWAGHCFDIVPLEQGGVSPVGDGWTDVTDEVVKQAMTVAEKPGSNGVPAPIAHPVRGRQKSRIEPIFTALHGMCLRRL